MDNLGQAGCVDIIIDRINKDLRERPFGFHEDSKCDAFASGPIGRSPIGSDPKLNAGHSLCEPPERIVSLKNESLSKNDRPSANNPLSDLTVHGQLTENLNGLPSIQMDLNEPKTIDQNGTLTYHNQPNGSPAINLPHRASEPSSPIIDLEDNQPKGNQLTSDQLDHQLTSSQLSAQAVDQSQLIDSTTKFEMSAVDQDLSSLPLPDFSLLNCDLPMEQSDKAVDGQPYAVVHSNTTEHGPAIRMRVSNGSDDCSS